MPSSAASGSRRRPASPTIAVVGAGVVGGRVARELVSSPHRPRVAILTRRAERAEQLRASFGADAAVVLGEAVTPGRATTPDLPATTSVVVLCGEEAEHHLVAEEQIRLGRHVVSTAQGTRAVERLVALHDLAVAHDVSVVLGAGFSPGLSSLMVAHGARKLDRLDEVHIARLGSAGAACTRELRAAARGTVAEWKDGSWREQPAGGGRELCWFPDPVGGRDCYRVGTAEGLLLVRARGDLRRVTVRAAWSALERVMVASPVPPPPRASDDVGALRVELRGELDGAREAIVLGILDRPGVTAGAVAAVVAMELGGGTGARPYPAGVSSPVETEDPGPTLVELRRRGVRVAVFNPA